MAPLLTSGNGPTSHCVAQAMTTTVVANGYGGPDVLRVIDEPSPLPGPSQVVVDVRAAGVNPIDYKSYSGRMGADPSQLPKRLGSEAAGVVSVVGSNVTDFAV